MNDDFETFLGQAGQRILATAEERNATLRAFIAAQPQTIPCPTHPGVEHRISFEATQKATRAQSGIPTARYESCPLCEQGRVEQLMRRRLRLEGVPANMPDCTLENWNPADSSARSYLDDVRQFACEEQRGFLVLLGDVGTGKTHLAIGVQRCFKSGLFVKQSTLLRRLRATYGDKNAVDPVQQCQTTELLVLDEAGLSGGGRDELPMLNDILDHRYGEMKPTVITGNLDWKELQAGLGERMADRLQEGCWRVITLVGKSHRGDARQKYFGAK